MTAYDTVMIVIDKLDAGEIDAALIDSVATYHMIFSNENKRISHCPTVSVRKNTPYGQIKRNSSIHV